MIGLKMTLKTFNQLLSATKTAHAGGTLFGTAKTKMNAR